MQKIKLLAEVNGVPAGTVGVLYGAGTRSTGGLTLRFDRPGQPPEVLTNVAPELVAPIVKQLTAGALIQGGRYNWKNQPERLIYEGYVRPWHLFEKVGAPGVIWCEVLSVDLDMLEVTK